jgi:hypothetical protein
MMPTMQAKATPRRWTNDLDTPDDSRAAAENSGAEACGSAARGDDKSPSARAFAARSQRRDRQRLQERLTGYGN